MNCERSIIYAFRVVPFYNRKKYKVHTKLFPRTFSNKVVFSSQCVTNTVYFITEIMTLSL